ncbi:MAG: hypothetical protein J2P34_06075 [Actinobacteria bacterium]|nr:hypothetical protein [Actinomycetota bacterium]
MDSIPQRRGDPWVTRGAYALLFLLGLLQGLIGCFQFGGTVGPVPLAALVLCAALFATCLLGGLGMRSAAGAFAPAAGWFLASVGLALPTGGGSVIVTNTTAGLWYLYGGAIVAVVAIVLAFTAWTRPRAGRR